MWICERCVKCTGCTPQLITEWYAKQQLCYVPSGKYTPTVLTICCDSLESLDTGFQVAAHTGGLYLADMCVTECGYTINL